MHFLLVDKIYYSQKLITQKYFLIEDTLKLFSKPAAIIDMTLSVVPERVKELLYLLYYILAVEGAFPHCGTHPQVLLFSRRSEATVPDVEAPKKSAGTIGCSWLLPVS